MLDRNDLPYIIEQLKKDLLPIGSILIYPSERVPSGYLPCDGRELSKRSYQELYSLIKGTWGETRDTFFLPDLQGQFVRGWDNEGDVDPDRKLGSTQTDAFQGHSHEFCVSAIKTEEAGQHDHDLYWGKFDMRDSSVYSSNNHKQYLPLKYSQVDELLYDRIGKEYTYADGSTLEGTHSHKLQIKDGQRVILDPTDSIYGTVCGKVCNETRPKNVALIFCIKVR